MKPLILLLGLFAGAAYWTWPVIVWVRSGSVAAGALLGIEIIGSAVVMVVAAKCGDGGREMARKDKERMEAQS